MIVISSMVLHRSGRNVTDSARRAFMPQYSAGIIYNEENQPLAFAVPLKDQ